MPCRCVPAVDITLYLAPSMKEGEQARAYFNRRGVAYEVLDVSSDPEALSKMQELSDQTERPVVVINDQVLVGYQPEQFDLFVPSLHL